MRYAKEEPPSKGERPPQSAAPAPDGAQSPTARPSITALFSGLSPHWLRPTYHLHARIISLVEDRTADVSSHHHCLYCKRKKGEIIAERFTSTAQTACCPGFNTSTQEQLRLAWITGRKEATGQISPGGSCPRPCGTSQTDMSTWEDPKIRFLTTLKDPSKHLWIHILIHISLQTVALLPDEAFSFKTRVWISVVRRSKAVRPLFQPERHRTRSRTRLKTCCVSEVFGAQIEV